jgi:hypothetical protein
MFFKSMFVAVAMFVAALSIGCAGTTPHAYERSHTGALIGAAAGGIIGAVAGGSDGMVNGAVLGGLGGAGVGAAIGRSEEGYVLEGGRGAYGGGRGVRGSNCYWPRDSREAAFCRGQEDARRQADYEARRRAYEEGRNSSWDF